MLYHLVPQRVVGSRLLPLNQLRQSHPALYEAYARKYQGREHLLKQPVPGLECLWSDVLFLTAVPPDVIREMHEAAGFEVPPLRWFEIDPRALDAARLYVYWYLHSDPDLKEDPATGSRSGRACCRVCRRSRRRRAIITQTPRALRKKAVRVLPDPACAVQGWPRA